VTPKQGGGGAGKPRRDKPAKGPKGPGGESRDARRAVNIKGGKAARDARRAEAGKKGNKPPAPGAPDPRGEGYWGDQRGPEYWAARKAAKKAGRPLPGPGETSGPSRGPRRDGPARPPRGGRPESERRGRGDRGDRRDDRREAVAPPLPRDFQGDGQLLYGRNAVHEVLRAGRRPVRAVWATAATLEGEGWLAELDEVEVRLADSDGLTALAGSPDHQGVVAAVDAYPYVELSELLARPDPLIIALDEVQDPQNLGAIARTAECVGATGMIICRHRAAEVTPAAVKASAGATEHLPIVQARNLADALAEAKGTGAWIYGAAGREDGAVPYTEPDYTGGCVLVMGAEGTGLRARVTATCDQLVALPLRGHLDSLNVGAASAALLYAILQQRERVDTGT
jgi:23S rRNA (guanosine2251-2'-O)-methyltransferase